MHERAQLLAYLRRSWSALRPGGVFVLDTFGGPESLVAFKRRRPLGASVRYTFEQVAYDGVTARSQCRIHFRFADGSVLRSAFTYDWRRWSLPELVDALAEAGFLRAEVWLAPSDIDSGAFASEYQRSDVVDIADAGHWNAYVIARRPPHVQSS